MLARIGVLPDEVRPADIDETPLHNELPRNYCARVARAKAEATVLADDEIVLCADTTVALGRRILGKPADRQEAAQFLKSLEGRRHRVLTSVAVRSASRVWTRDVESRVRMKNISEQELETYLDSDEWCGKAGGYSIQGRAGAFIPWMSGSYSAVVGLPLFETAQLLNAAGFSVWASR